MWAAEQELLGPGLQAVVQWAQIGVREAAGARIWDVDGREYIDLMGGAGVNSVGHCHPHVRAALHEQLDRWMIGAFSSEARLRMLQLLGDVLPAGLDRVQLYTSGAEAVEAALRLAKSATGKHEILRFWGGFHGKTLGAMSLTSAPQHGVGPLASGSIATPYANCRRCPLRLRHPECGFACVDLAEQALDEQSTGELAAIVVEPIQGKSGNVVPPAGYLAALHALARRRDALLIVDETLTGFGRTGTMFACQGDGVSPDIIVMGKGMGSGYPVSAIASTAALMSAGSFALPSASSSSYGGFPLACAATAATLEVIASERLAENATQIGEEMVSALSPLVESSDVVSDVRGRGLMIGIELTASSSINTSAMMRETFSRLLERGVIVMVGGEALRLYPPLSIDRATAMEAVERISAVLTSTAP